MIKVLLIPMLALLMMSCTMQGNDQKKNLELIDNYVKAVENMDYKAMGNYLDDGYMGLGPSIGDSINKDQAIENWQTMVENLYGSIKYNRSRSITATIADGENKGEWVSNWAEVTINYKDGRGSVTIMANTLYRIENGKITKSYTFYNEADALRQLGYSFILE